MKQLFGLKCGLWILILGARTAEEGTVSKGSTYTWSWTWSQAECGSSLKWHLGWWHLFLVELLKKKKKHLSHFILSILNVLKICRKMKRKPLFYQHFIMVLKELRRTTFVNFEHHTLHSETPSGGKPKSKRFFSFEEKKMTPVSRQLKRNPREREK